MNPGAVEVPVSFPAESKVTVQLWTRRNETRSAGR